jgi:aryl-alcohol dehydrogenase
MTISSASRHSWSTRSPANATSSRFPKDVPLELLGPLGCGIQTGAGAVLKALNVHAGSSFVAFGAGAVGLSAVMAARVGGATRIIAVDVNQARLDLAMELGATDTVNSRTRDAVAEIKRITGQGADFTLEYSGRPDVLRQAIDSLGIFGVCGIVGATKEGTEVAFNVNDVMLPGRRIVGIVQGDVVAQTFRRSSSSIGRVAFRSIDWCASTASTRSTRRWPTARAASRSNQFSR